MRNILAFMYIFFMALWFLRSDFKDRPPRTPILQGGAGDWSLITPSLWSILPIGCGKEGKAGEAGLPKQKEIA